jgi:ATP synthase protein I
LQLSSIGIEMGVATMIGIGLGWTIEKYVFKEKYYPWITILFLFFGFVAGIKNVLHLIKNMDTKENDND